MSDKALLLRVFDFAIRATNAAVGDPAQSFDAAMKAFHVVRQVADGELVLFNADDPNQAGNRQTGPRDKATAQFILELVSEAAGPPSA